MARQPGGFGELSLAKSGLYCGLRRKTVEAAIMAGPGVGPCRVRIGRGGTGFDESKAHDPNFVAAIRRAGAFDIDQFEAVYRKIDLFHSPRKLCPRPSFYASRA